MANDYGLRVSLLKSCLRLMNKNIYFYLRLYEEKSSPDFKQDSTSER